MKDLNKLSKEVFEANKAKGFHEEEHSVEHMLCLVISELMEAVEADRKGRKADMEHYVDILGSPAHKNGISNEDWSHLFQHTIKDSVEDELADAVIRLLDTAGAWGLAVDKTRFEKVRRRFNALKAEQRSFLENVYHITSLVYLVEDIELKLISIITSISELCDLLNIDLLKHVELKLKYNSLRPHKHGKKY